MLRMSWTKSESTGELRARCRGRTLSRAVNNEAATMNPSLSPAGRQYVRRWQFPSGTTVTIRPIRPEDQNKMMAFHQTLSLESVYLRYAGILGLSERITHDRLSRLCFIAHGREMALVAETDGAESMAPEIIAVGRLSRLAGTRDGEYSMLVTDRYQRQGLGSEISRRLLDVAHDWRLERIVADVLPQNGTMQRVLRTLGFRLQADGGSVRAIKLLPQ